MQPTASLIFEIEPKGGRASFRCMLSCKFGAIFYLSSLLFPFFFHQVEEGWFLRHALTRCLAQ